MPQLIAYYWLNQISWTLAGLAIITYVVSVYILPPVLETLVSRIFVIKL